MRDDEAILTDFAVYLDEQIVTPAVRQLISAIEKKEEPKRPWTMLGDYLREAAVLILILVPLDLLIPEKAIRPRWILLTLLLSSAMLAGGMWAERRNR